MANRAATTELLPPGSHAVSFHGSLDEAVRNMAGFVRGGYFFRQPSAVFSNDADRIARYRAAVAPENPWLKEAFHEIAGLHVRNEPGGWRPIDAPMRFASEHPEGVSICGDTLAGAIDRSNLEEALRYEAWFDALRPFPHRAMCPYDLGRMPVELANEVLPGMAARHSHVVLSSDPRPSVQLLQLLVVPSLSDAPPIALHWRSRALDRGLLRPEGDDRALRLTPRGELLVRATRVRPGARVPAPG